jgi:radical SAM protein with 4Fe4S-binding SPASM domain
MAGLFAEFSPIGIDISIYGATAAVHDNITRSSGSFEKTMTGIEALRRHKVRFSLKTIIMTLNRADLGNMKALAASLGVKFHFDSIISPRTDGGMLPARYRLSADEMVQLELDEDYESCKRAFDGYWNKKPTGAFTCGAGVFAFNISPYGVLSPCNMFRSFQYPLREAPFGGLWKRMVAERDEKQGGFFPEECRSCSMFLLCSNCPAWEELETGSWQKKVEYTCEYAKCFEREFFKKKEMISAIKE